jgi:beta-xylosidase
MEALAKVYRRLRSHFLHMIGRTERPEVDGLPVYPRDFPDPYILGVGSTFYAYATQAGDTNVQVMRSSDLVTWEHLGDALSALPAWAGPDRTWAPAVLPRGDQYVLYYTVREPSSDRQCISVAVADQPEGPFIDTSAGPFIFQLERGGSIDPSPFVDADGTAYLLWKSDDNALDQPSSLWAQPLTADGLALTDAPTEVLRHDRDWERPLIEAPAMVRHEGRYYLFYSANWWESADYAIGYATGPAPLGPFRKVTRSGPWMATAGQAAGPGGQEFFTDDGDALRMAYHAWTPGAVGYGAGGARSLRIARIGFVNGRPVIGR